MGVNSSLTSIRGKETFYTSDSLIPRTQLARRTLLLASTQICSVKVSSIDRKSCKYLQECVAAGKRERLGMFEFGDVEEDE